MSLTATEQTDVIRFCGYPARGVAANANAGFRYMTHYGQLEFRMLNLAPEEETVVRVMLVDCNALEVAMVGAGANLDTDRAAVWVHNRDEVKHRKGLLTERRMDLIGLFGIPPGPSLAGNTLRRVV